MRKIKEERLKSETRKREKQGGIETREARGRRERKSGLGRFLNQTPRPDSRPPESVAQSVSTDTTDGHLATEPTGFGCVGNVGGVGGGLRFPPLSSDMDDCRIDLEKSLLSG
ncbi:hypothetical protein COLO4_34191 [Corchorus olitorius]|uniref:Uncharacterized protein n=1 Tax=Corchorus olitorius TaxID=93759 RepID=A0A1R3GN94_9ROSI|nr:hypothetical protein COLO4_34191 [Corchorus olitorius]